MVLNRVLITGASGLLGSHIVKQILVEKSWEITILVQSEYKAKFWNSLGIETLIGDLSNCKFNIENSFNSIIHVAAIAGDWVDKKLAYQVNVKATRFLLDQAIKIGCGSFLFVSTIGVYGHSAYVDATESKKYKKSSFYENTKIEAEKLILSYAKYHSNIRLMIMRPTSMYGEGDRHILPRFIKYLARRKFIFIGGGNNLYPILHANDAANAILLQLQVQNGNSIYHLCDNSKISFKDFITILISKLGLNYRIKSIPYSVAYSLSILLEGLSKLTKKEPFLFRKRVKYLGVTRNISISKVINELNFKPVIQPKSGIGSVLKAMSEEEEMKKQLNEPEILKIIPYHLYKFLTNRS